VNRSKIVTIVIVALVVLFAGLIAINLLGLNEDDSAQAGRGGTRMPTAVRVTPVESGTIERSVILNGEILARNQVIIFPTVGGRLAQMRVNIGDRVNAGVTVAMIDPSRPGEVFSHSPVVSTVSGTVLHAPFHVGDTLSTQSGVIVVGDLTQLVIETHVPERFVAAVTPGMTALLRFEALGGETFNAQVTEISPVLDPVTRTLRIRLGLVNHDPRIRVGMFATISLVTNRSVNVPVIPRTAVIATHGAWTVFVVDEDNIAHRRTITLGLDDEDFIEVLSGVELGENVVSAGQNLIADGDSVRLVN